MGAVSKAVEKKTDTNSPTALIRRYSGDFASVLPSHIKAATWVRLAEGALKKGKRIADPKSPQHGMFELEVAAANNPGVFLAALLDAARLGLEPGTEQYYLTPRRIGGKNGRLEILGITGYQGHIELMYRAGAVASVVAEVVRTGDGFVWKPGALDSHVPPRWQGPQVRPWHDVDWFGSRGDLKGVYAYAEMLGGATSKVVVLNRDDIERIKRSSQGSDSEYSPWVNHEAAMWLKSAVRQLQKWVPTSAEYRREQLRAAAEAQRVATGPDTPAGADVPMPDYVDGEVVDEPAGAASDAAEDWPATAQPPDADGGGRP